MSDVFRSSFSYQVAVGSTMSPYRQVVDMRKSSTTSRSSLPSAAGRILTSRGLMQCSSLLINAFWVPSRYFRKYSWPLPELPMMLERQTNILRGKLAGLSGSSHEKASVPALICASAYAAGSWPAALAARVTSSGLVCSCGADGSQPMRSALAL